jgi:predicted transcriptional regulator
MSKMASLSYRVPAELKAALKKLAEADRRKLGAYVQLVLEEHVERSSGGKPAVKRK